jgi:hypothetical protein
MVRFCGAKRELFEKTYGLSNAAFYSRPDLASRVPKGNAAFDVENDIF